MDKTDNKVERTLAEAAFITDELRLFLDTHPTSEQALKDYRCAAEQVYEARSEHHYAVNALDAGGCGNWDWVCAPFPWEKEA